MDRFRVFLTLCFMIIAGIAHADYKFRDHKPVNIQGTPPNAYQVHGLDVSRYQGGVNWRAVKQAGIDFVYVKATEGSDRTDPMFYDHTRGASQAGLRVGAYHFYHFCSSPEENARQFIRSVPKVRGWLPPAVDMEWNHLSPCKRRPPAAQIRAELARYMQLVEASFGQKPVIYTNMTFYRDGGFHKIGGVEMWLRSTTAHPNYRYNVSRWLLWQYTGTGAVPGVRGNVDINAFAGKRSDWNEWLRDRAIR